jgi:uncharacterized protein YigA (DUF484 family)
MSAEKQPAATTGSEISEEQVRDYLKAQGDFLQRNPDLLDHLHVSHASGSAVSLVEKQVSVLRERNTEMRHRLNALTATARENDLLYEHTRSTVLRLLDAGTVDELYDAFLGAMREDFAVEHATMILFGDGDTGERVRYESPERAKIEIGPLLRGRKPVCGVLRQEELTYLFPDAGAVGSAALVPLSRSEELGLIAVGSSDAERYHTGMGTLFLTHIADILVRLIPRLQRGAA